MIRFIKKLFLPSGVAQPVERHVVNVRRDSSILSPGAISRRKFFSFFGVGAALLAKPDLFLPKGPFGTPWGTPNVLTSGGYYKAAAAMMGRNFAEMEEALFFQMLCNPVLELLPNVPFAADGVALFSTTPHRIDWAEDKELKRLAGW